MDLQTARGEGFGSGPLVDSGAAEVKRARLAFGTREAITAAHTQQQDRMDGFKVISPAR
jgi:hypothetical protein